MPRSIKANHFSRTQIFAVLLWSVFLGVCGYVLVANRSFLTPVFLIISGSIIWQTRNNFAHGPVNQKKSRACWIVKTGLGVVFVVAVLFLPWFKNKGARNPPDAYLIQLPESSQGSSVDVIENAALKWAKYQADSDSKNPPPPTFYEESLRKNVGITRFLSDPNIFQKLLTTLGPERVPVLFSSTHGTGMQAEPQPAMGLNAVFADGHVESVKPWWNRSQSDRPFTQKTRAASLSLKITPACENTNFAFQVSRELDVDISDLGNGEANPDPDNYVIPAIKLFNSDPTVDSVKEKDSRVLAILQDTQDFKCARPAWFEIRRIKFTVPSGYFLCENAGHGFWTLEIKSTLVGNGVTNATPFFALVDRESNRPVLEKKLSTSENSNSGEIDNVDCELYGFALSNRFAVCLRSFDGSQWPELMVATVGIVLVGLLTDWVKTVLVRLLQPDKPEPHKLGKADE